MATIKSIKVKSKNVTVKSKKWKFKFLSKSLLFDWFLCQFSCQTHSSGPFLCKFWWHNFKNWALERKNYFTINFVWTVEKWGQNYDLFIFQVLNAGAFLGLEMNSLGWYYGCFGILFVSEHPGWYGERTWKMNKICHKLQNTENLYHTTLTANICGKLAPHPYVSYIFRNVWISSFTLSSLNLYYVVKITHKLRFTKKIQIFAN